MVKNTTGGNKSKGQARKFITPKQNISLRTSQDDCEVYAQVTKLLGNGMCHVLCIDGTTRLCHIRGKFRGRGKRDNFIGTNSWILVGLREWELNKDGSSKLQNCDLLEVYSDFDKEKLKTNINTIDWSQFISNDNKNCNVKKEEQEAVDFMDERADEYEELLRREISSTNRGNGNITITMDDSEINVDDI